jgi:uncharacterized membrane protein YkvA (DUF1232 family)
MANKNKLRIVYDDDFYQALRKRTREWSVEKGKTHKYLEYVLAGPDLLHLMGKLTMSPAVPNKSKAKLGLAIAYFISPIDLLPEAILGPTGYLDDIALAAWVIDDLVKTSGPELVIENWAGEGDVLQTVEKIIDAANEMLGSGLFRRLREAFNNQEIGLKSFQPLDPNVTWNPGDTE